MAGKVAAISFDRSASTNRKSDRAVSSGPGVLEPDEGRASRYARNAAR
jgi:hypothetical protein